MTSVTFVFFKTFGAALVLAGFALLGVRYDRNRRRSVHAITDLIGSLEVLRAEIGFRLSPIPEALEMVRIGSCGEVARFYDCCVQNLQFRGAQYLPEIWVRCVEECFPFLREQHRGVLESLAGTLGRYGADDQVAAIRYAETRFKTFLEQAEQEEARIGRLFITISCALGITVVLLFL